MMLLELVHRQRRKRVYVINVWREEGFIYQVTGDFRKDSLRVCTQNNVDASMVIYRLIVLFLVKQGKWNINIYSSL